MQVTITIPDEFAAQVEARGLTPQGYIEHWVAEQTTTLHKQASVASRVADLERFFRDMAAESDKIPLLSDEAFTRESYYREHG